MTNIDNHRYTQSTAPRHATGLESEFTSFEIQEILKADCLEGTLDPAMKLPPAVQTNLVGGWPIPLKKIRVRQLGWWHSQYMGKYLKMFQATNQKCWKHLKTHFKDIRKNAPCTKTLSTTRTTICISPPHTWTCTGNANRRKEGASEVQPNAPLSISQVMWQWFRQRLRSPPRLSRHPFWLSTNFNQSQWLSCGLLALTSRWKNPPSTALTYPYLYYNGLKLLRGIWWYIMACDMSDHFNVI